MTAHHDRLYGPGEESAMRRVAWAVVAALLCAVVGAAVGWVVLRPSRADMVTAARELVPEGFVVQAAGVDEGVVPLGWPDVAGALATDPDRPWREVTDAEVAEPGGWRVTGRDAGRTRRWIDVSRPGFDADVMVRADAAGSGTEVEVHLRRDGSERTKVWAAAGAGAVVGAPLVAWGRRRARRRRVRRAPRGRA